MSDLLRVYAPWYDTLYPCDEGACQLPAAYAYLESGEGGENIVRLCATHCWSHSDENHVPRVGDRMVSSSGRSGTFVQDGEKFDDWRLQWDDGEKP